MSDLLKAGWSHYLRRAGEVIVLVENNNAGTSTGGGGGVAVKVEGSGSGASSSSSSSSSTSRDKSLVDDLLAFQERMECVLRFAFGNHEGFRYTLKSAFEHFLNIQPSRPAKLLADFVDRKMRGEKGLGDAEVDAVLDKVRHTITGPNPNSSLSLTLFLPLYLTLVPVLVLVTVGDVIVSFSTEQRHFRTLLQEQTGEASVAGQICLL